MAPAWHQRVNWSKALALWLLVGCLWLLYALFSSARFHVTQVSVTGKTRLVREAELRDAMDVLHRSIFRLSPVDVEEHLRSQYAFIAGATVRFKLPNQAMLSVEEYDTVSIWESDGRYWWIGSDRRVLGMTHDLQMVLDPSELLVVRDADGIAPAPEGFLVGVPWAYAQALARVLPRGSTYDFNPEAGLMMRVRPDARGGSTRGPSASDSQGRYWTVFLGHGGNAQTKVGLMWALIDRLSSRGIDVEYIDLRSERRPSYKPR